MVTYVRASDGGKIDGGKMVSALGKMVSTRVGNREHIKIVRSRRLFCMVVVCCSKTARHGFFDTKRRTCHLLVGKRCGMLCPNPVVKIKLRALKTWGVPLFDNGDNQ